MGHHKRDQQEPTTTIRRSWIGIRIPVSNYKLVYGLQFGGSLGGNLPNSNPLISTLNDTFSQSDGKNEEKTRRRPSHLAPLPFLASNHFSLNAPPGNNNQNEFIDLLCSIFP